MTFKNKNSIIILESEEQTMTLKNIQELNKEIFLIIRDIVGIKNVGVAFGSDFYTYERK